MLWKLYCLWTCARSWRFSSSKRRWFSAFSMTTLISSTLKGF
ncbi:MAG: hypothetical protein R3F39_08380 [Myxococcota bacterium]